MLAVEPAAGFGLNGTKMHKPFTVTLQNKLDGVVAQVANAIKEQQIGMFGRGDRHGKTDQDSPDSSLLKTGYSEKHFRDGSTE